MIEESNKDKSERLKELEETVEDAEEIAEKFGLNPKPVNFWIVDYDEIYKLVANDGFPERYSHWRRGMKYERFKQGGELGLSKIYELVINDDPCHAYLQKSNPDHIQKAVISHVIGHSDFFGNNRNFEKLAGRMHNNSVEMMKDHSKAVDRIISQENVSKREVEEWIDTVLTIEDNIDPNHEFKDEMKEIQDTEEELTESEAREKLTKSLGDPSEEIMSEVFSDVDILDLVGNEDDNGHQDLLLYILDNGLRYDEEENKAVEMEGWRKEIVTIIRKESYYLAPQKLSNTMNEGWANYWESKMMNNEKLADEDEYIQYGKFVSKIRSAGEDEGMNPYDLGRKLWDHIEEKENRDEIFEKLLSVEGVTPRNIFEEIDSNGILDHVRVGEEYSNITPEHVKTLLDNSPEDIDEEVAREYLDNNLDYNLKDKPWRLFTYEGHTKRHYCFNYNSRVGILHRTTTEYLENMYHTIMDPKKYDSISEALNDIDYTRGWDKMRNIRRTNTDASFISYFDREMQEKHNFIQKQFDPNDEQYKQMPDEYLEEITPEEQIKQMRENLIIQYSNFGKPKIVAEDNNYKNKRELLLTHKYNGISLNKEQAKETLKRVHKLWGRPVHIQTIDKEYNGGGPMASQEATEKELLISYNGEEFEESEGPKIEGDYSNRNLHEDYEVSELEEHF